MQYVLSLPGQYQDEADEDMGQKDLQHRMELLTGRVTALEHTKAISTLKVIATEISTSLRQHY